MTTVTVKLPENLSRSLEHEARRRGLPKSAVIRESLERTLTESREKGDGPSCLDLVADLVGIFDGPADSSTNKGYFYEALEKDHRHGGGRLHLRGGHKIAANPRLPLARATTNLAS